VPYALIVLAAPAYLKKIGELRPYHTGMCVAALALLCIPAVGSVYPIPSAPVMYFPYLFLLYIAVGAAWIIFAYRRNPDQSARVHSDLSLTHSRFVPSLGATHPA
jgi:hypothetical protein